MMERSLPILGVISALAIGMSVAAEPAHAADLQDVREALAASALAGLPDTVVRVDVARLEVHGDLPPGGTVYVEAGGRLGRIRLPVTVRAADGSETSLHASAELVAWVDVPVLRRSAGKGSPLRLDDVILRPRSLDGVPAGTVTDPHALVGRTPRRDLQLGSTIRESDLSDRVDARRGRPVRVEVRSPGLVIRADGVLREDAGIGDWTSVSTRDGGVLRGRLVAADLIVIERTSS